MRCGRCGNENNESNRFCGMCGAPLVAKGQGAVQPASAGPASIPPRTSTPVPPADRPSSQAVPALTSVQDRAAERPSVPVSHTRPEPVRAQTASDAYITGPSFLGLNTPPAGGGRHFERHDSSGDGDHLRPSSSNLDYLLDDEEEPKRGGGGKLIFFLIALALAGGFGYLHWKSGGFDWLTGGDKKAAITKPAPDGTQNTSDSTGAAAAPSSSTSSSTSASAPAANAPVTPVPTDAAPSNPAPAPDATANTQTSPPNASQEGTPPAASTDPNAAANSVSHPPDANSGPSDDSSQSAKDKAQDDEEEPAAVEKTAPRKPAAVKPSATRPAMAKPTPATSYDSVAEAERYIYGRGVSQDCDHGLRLLKPAGNQGNPKAMISLGSLYSTGTCTPRDLPTAYRWFAMALHKQPDNLVLQNDLQKLWSQMTQPERQLAIKLSQ